MAYYREICIAGDVKEVRKYHAYTARNMKKSKSKPIKPTTEQKKKQNQMRAERDLRRLMNANFSYGDYLVRLDFFKEQRPVNEEEMQKMIHNAIKRLRRQADKMGIPLRYIYVKEIGKKGSKHIHMLINKIDVDMLRTVWTHGGIHIDPIYSKNLKNIAAYFIKYAAKTEETQGKLLGKRWYASRNLKKPIVIKEKISANTFRKEPQITKGYELEKDSVCGGISEITGYEWFQYTLIRTNTGGKTCKT